MKQNRQSKYAFASLYVGSVFTVASLDVPSMRSSLTAFNKRHGVEIAIEVERGPGKNSSKVTVLSITKKEAAQCA